MIAKKLFLVLAVGLGMIFSGGEATEMKTVIIMFGAPGVGKGVQASRLHKELGLPHISTGDLFRENMRNQTPLGMKAKSYIDKGHLVPDELVLDMLFDRVSKSDCEQGYILDGFPRTIPQAQALQGHFTENDNVLVLNLTAPEQLIIDRITARQTCRSCGKLYNKRFTPSKVEDICDECGGDLYTRSDDTEETVRDRLRVYAEQTAPVKDFYAEQGIVTDIDSTKDLDIVFEQLMGIVK